MYVLDHCRLPDGAIAFGLAYRFPIPGIFNPGEGDLISKVLPPVDYTVKTLMAEILTVFSYLVLRDTENGNVNGTFSFHKEQDMMEFPIWVDDNRETSASDRFVIPVRSLRQVHDLCVGPGLSQTPTIQGTGVRDGIIIVPTLDSMGWTIAGANDAFPYAAAAIAAERHKVLFARNERRDWRRYSSWESFEADEWEPTPPAPE